MLNAFKNFVGKAAKKIIEPSTQQILKDYAVGFTAGYIGHSHGNKIAEKFDEGSSDVSEPKNKQKTK